MEAIFQPQSTPFLSVNAYGVGNDIVNLSGYLELSAPGAGESSSTHFQDPVFPHITTDHQAHADAFSRGHSHHFSRTLYGRGIKMENNDIEEQERLAREYNQPSKGPMVGEKLDSQTITEEYAKADPIYIAKTAALPQKYSHYRPIAGDGSCGWRALGFSYFEALLGLGDPTVLDDEYARMSSLSSFLTTVGGHIDYIVDGFAEETLQLIQDLRDAIGSPDAAAAILLERFNGDSASSIIVHFRMLASTTLKGNLKLYENFIAGTSVQEVCQEIDGFNTEIDHLGVQLLFDVLLKPAAIALEIVYLDRSPGSQANNHILQELDLITGSPLHPNGPMVHLLYRPSHYDILYKQRRAALPLQEPVMPVQSSNVHIHRAVNFSQQHTIQSVGNYSSDMNLLFSIPGSTFCDPLPSHHGFPSQFSTYDHYSTSPISASVSPGPPSVVHSSTPSTLSVNSNFAPQHQQSQHDTLTTPILNSSHTTIQLPVQTRPGLPTHSPVSEVIPNSSFRPSKYEWEAIADSREAPVAFTTSTFKNSHYNVAHYNNPHFQPEEWNPESEEAGCAPTRKRSSG